MSIHPHLGCYAGPLVCVVSTVEVCYPDKAFSIFICLLSHNFFYFFLFFFLVRYMEQGMIWRIPKIQETD